MLVISSIIWEKVLSKSQATSKEKVLELVVGAEHLQQILLALGKEYK